MTEGEKFIVSIIQTKDISVLYGVQDEWFSRKEKALLKFVRSYYGDYGNLPPIPVINSDMGSDLQPMRGLNPVHCLASVKRRFVYTELTDKVPEALKNLKRSPESALDNLVTLVENLRTESGKSEDKHYAERASERFSAYTERKTKKGITYLSMGHKLLDLIFLGYGQTDLVTLGGKPGTKKTWAMLYLAALVENVLAELSDNLKSDFTLGPALFISNEMSDTQLIERQDALTFKLPWEKFLRGSLDRIEERRYKEGLTKLESEGRHLVFVYNCRTLAEVNHKISLYKPAVTFVDGSYLLEPDMEEGPSKTTYITRELKRSALVHRSPVVQSTQLRKKSSTTRSKSINDAQDDFFYGSYIQDSDVAIRSYVEPEMLYRETVGWEVAKGRNIKPNQSLTFEAPLTSMAFGFSEPDDYGNSPTYDTEEGMQNPIKSR